MSGAVEYRVFLDSKPIDRDLYRKIETITVEQTMDLAAEARLELELCSDKQGVWNGPSDAHARAWRRARVEVKNMAASWVPLIDGPIVAWDANMQGEPGRSMMTLVVRDDSVYLNRKVETRTFEGKSDTDVAKQLLRTEPIAEVDVDPLPARPADQPLKLMKVCTEIELLLELARPFARHVFVRPGDKPGRSIGCMKAIDPKRKPTLPALVLVGPKRNIDSFHVRSDATVGARHAGARLDIRKLAVAKEYTSSWTDVALLGDDDPFDTKQAGTERISPIDAAFHDVQEVANAKQQDSSFSLVGRGSIRAGCYHGVLTAYDVVATSGVDQKLCTTWVIRDVTHTLGRSEYRQDFTLIGNAVAKVTGTGTPIPPEII